MNEDNSKEGPVIPPLPSSQLWNTWATTLAGLVQLARSRTIAWLQEGHESLGQASCSCCELISSQVNSHYSALKASPLKVSPESLREDGGAPHTDSMFNVFLMSKKPWVGKPGNPTIVYSIAFRDKDSKRQTTDLQTSSSKLGPSCLDMYVHFVPSSSQHLSAESAAQALGPPVLTGWVRYSDDGDSGVSRRSSPNMFSSPTL